METPTKLRHSITEKSLEKHFCVKWVQLLSLIVFFGYGHIYKPVTAKKQKKQNSQQIHKKTQHFKKLGVPKLLLSSAYKSRKKPKTKQGLTFLK